MKFNKSYFVKDLNELKKYGFTRMWRDIYEKTIYGKEDVMVALLVNQVGSHTNELTLYIQSEKECDTTISLGCVEEIVRTIKLMLNNGILEDDSKETPNKPNTRKIEEFFNDMNEEYNDNFFVKGVKDE